MSSRASRPRRRIAAASAVALGALLSTYAGALRSFSYAVTPAAVPGCPVGSTQVSSDAALQALIPQTADDSVVCITESFQLSAQIVLDDTSLTLVGRDDSLIELDAAAGNRHITAIFPTGGVLTIDGLYLDQGAPAGAGSRGGSIYVVLGDLAVSNAQFGNGHAERGGAIYVQQGDISITDSQFRDLYAGESGGAVRGRGGNISVTRSDFLRTRAYNGSGGALFGDLDITITNSTFTDTFAGNGGSGGAIRSNNGSVYVTGGQFINTNAQLNGGAISADDTVSVSGTRFESSYSDQGGAIFANESVYASRATFIGSEARNGGGGAIRQNFGGGITIIRDSYFRANSATVDGGAISASRDVSVETSTFYSNEAGRNGGAIDVGSFKDLTVVNSTFFENTAGTGGVGRGGAISTSGGLSSSFSTFMDDSGNNPSSVLYASSFSFFTLEGSVVSPQSGAPVGACNRPADNQSFDSFATDSSCGVGDDTVNVVTRVQLGFDDTLVTDDSTGARVLIPDDTSILVNAAPANLVPSVTRDQLLALRGRAPDDSTTSGAVQVLPILITTQPQDAVVLAGASATFSAAAIPGVGTTVAYQWQSSSDGGQNWSDLAGQTSSSLVLASVPSSDDGLQVRVVVTDLRNQPVNSNPATLTVSSNPTPAPSFPPGPPRDVAVVAGVASVTVSWEPPASVGSFPVSTYQVEDESGRHTCVVTVTAGQPLECMIDGLDATREYSFRVRALNGAGWGQWSSLSDPVRPLPGRSILITGSRDGRYVRVEGETTGLAGEQLIPRVRFPGPTRYTTGTSRPQVNEAGEFTWQRRTNKKTYVYFFVEDVRSNRVIIKAR